MVFIIIKRSSLLSKFALKMKKLKWYQSYWQMVEDCDNWIICSKKKINKLGLL